MRGLRLEADEGEAVPGLLGWEGGDSWAQTVACSTNTSPKDRMPRTPVASHAE